MPGLYGFIALEGHPLIDPRVAQGQLHLIEQKLCHHRDYVCKTHIDPEAGIAIGAIGFPDQHISTEGKSSYWPGRSIQGFVWGDVQYHDSHGIYEQISSAEEDEDSTLLHSLKGSFAGCFVHHDNKKIILAADHRASQPICFMEHSRRLYFAPEPKALLAISAVNRDIDWGAFANFLARGYLLSGQTLFASIRQLSGGEYLVVDDGVVRRKRYWQFVPGKHTVSWSADQLAEHLGDRIDNAVARNIGDLKDTAVFLSGGADSRAILGATLNAVGGDNTRIQTITWGHNPDLPGSDLAISRQIAARFSLSHREMLTDNSRLDFGSAFYRMNYLLDGMGRSAAGQHDKLNIMRDLREMGFKRALRGDQLIGFGPGVSNREQAMVCLGMMPLESNTAFASVVQPEHLQILIDASREDLEKVRELHDCESPNDFKEQIYFRYRYQSKINRMAYYKQIYLDHRSPLLDRGVLEFLMTVPSSMKSKKELLYRTIHKHYPQFNDISYASATNTEGWGNLLSSNSSARDFLQQELEDRESGIWQYLKRERLLTHLSQINHAKQASARVGVFRQCLRSLRSNIRVPVLRTILDTREMKLAVAKELQPLKILQRALVLKNWYDVFVDERLNKSTSDYTEPDGGRSV